LGEGKPGAFCRHMNEDPALRATQLAPLTESSSRWTAEALYMTGEAAYQAQDYAKAKNAFDNLRQKFVDAQFTPDAVEGLGNVAENQGDYQGALAAYQEIKAKWAGSFASLRQDVNIGRCQEHFGNLPEAVKSYKAQVDLFPDSAVAGKAQESLDRLKLVHPEVFPAEKPEEPSGTPVAGAASTAPPGAEAVPNVDTSGTPSQEPPAAEKAVPPETEPEESGPSSASSAVEGDGTKPEVPAQQETAPAGGAQ